MAPAATISPVPTVELSFGDGRQRLWVTYREDMDGAIQLSPPGLNYGLTRIRVTKPEHAFGWLHDAAPYPVVMEGKRWNSVRHYLDSFDVELKVRAALASVAPITEAHQTVLRNAVLGQLREMALQNKFRVNPRLARRLRALRYPVQPAIANGYQFSDQDFLLSPI